MTRSRDLPLARDASARFLAWLIALTVFLGTLAWTASAVLADWATVWERGLTGSLTIQLTPDLSGMGAAGADGADAATFERRVTAVLAVLSAEPGIDAVHRLDDAETASLLDPWLDAGMLEELPLPALLDVTVADAGSLDLVGLERRLTMADPGTTLDTHQAWLSDLRDIVQAAQWLALTVMLLVGGAGLIAVVFAVRAGLAIHHHVIELLHLMGATDLYLARQFQSHVLHLSVRGAVAGLVSALAVMGLLYWFAVPSTQGLLPTLVISPVMVAGMVAVPMVVCLLASLTARWIVLRSVSILP